VFVLSLFVFDTDCLAAGVSLAVVTDAMFVDSAVYAAIVSPALGLLILVILVP